jgi:hypothetical protein
MQTCRLGLLSLVVLVLPATTALATEAKIGDEVCKQLRLKEAKVEHSGLLNDMSKGPAWAKANLSPAKLLEIKNYIALNEQVQFGCRDAKLTAEAERASTVASRIELNPDADPTKPHVADPPKPAASPAKKDAKKRTRRRGKSSRHQRRRSGKVTHAPPDARSEADAPEASHLLGFETTVIRAPRD